MLWVLLRKDFQRIGRNPWPWVLNLALPLAITALFGLAFGGKDDGSEVARIKVAIVDEDRSLLGTFFKSALSQGQAADHFDSITLHRKEAVAQLQADKLSAVIIVPTNFTSDYLLGKSGLVLEVIKNPAQSFYPAIVEELGAVAVTGMNAISRNLQMEFPAIRGALTNEFNFEKLAGIFERLGNRASTIGEYINPPLVSYQKAKIEKKETEKANRLSVFAFILPGMASAFLLFLADHAMRDIHHERRAKTLSRIQSIAAGMGMFVTEKVIFTTLTVFLGSAILFAGGSFIFGIDWGSPGLIALACAAYSLFAAGLMAMLVAAAGTERKSERINTMVLFGIAFAGGSYFPANSLPAFVRDWICPVMPNYWFIESIRAIASGESFRQSFSVVLQLGLAGMILAVAASYLLHRYTVRGATT